jgi:hypothetical protein
VSVCCVFQGGLGCKSIRLTGGAKYEAFADVSKPILLQSWALEVRARGAVFKELGFSPQWNAFAD